MLLDLHRHLEGSIRPTTVLECAHRDGHWLSRHEFAEGQLSASDPLPGLLPYLDKIDNGISALPRLEDWRRVGREAVEDAARDGIDYVELRFAPGVIARAQELAAEAVVDAVVDGVRSSDHGVRVGLIGILVRTFGPGVADEDLSVIRSRQDRFVGIDLAGDEHGWSAELFARHFDRARDAGLRATVHAGEGAGPESVTTALDQLRPERIGHGARSAEDPRLVERLAREDVGLELALTSNVHTATVPSLAEHPVSALLRAGVPITLNTDNPTTSGTTLTAERAAARQAGLTDVEIRQAAVNARRMAFHATD